MEKTEMTVEQRLKRIVARGEHSGHDHIVTGDVLVEEKDGRIVITVGEDSNAALQHLLEKPWLEGKEVWTGEHQPIPLPKGIYTFPIQTEYDVYGDAPRQVFD
jgi:hypothetical protein